VGKFEFWFELWKQSYFSLFFPNISLELGIIERIEGGYSSHSTPCPPHADAMRERDLTYFP
jgi:hypothetical protein